MRISSQIQRKRMPRWLGGSRWRSFATEIRATYAMARKRAGGGFLKWHRAGLPKAFVENYWLLFARFPLNLLRASSHLSLREHFHTQKSLYLPSGYKIIPGARIERTLERQRALVLRSVRLLEPKTVHTSVRTVVREHRSVERYRAVPELTVLPRPAAHVPTTPTSILTISPQAEATGNVSPAELHRAPGASRVVSPEVDVGRIADLVMRQMDHRISAWRERRGRG